MSNPEDSSLSFELTLKGKLSAENLAQFTSLISTVATIESVSLTPVANYGDILGAKEIESRFDTEYLFPVEIEGTPTYLVTRQSMHEFFKKSGGASLARITTAWQNLDNHSMRLHNPFDVRLCPCTMHPVFRKDPLDNRQGSKTPNFLGITPDGLASVAPILSGLPTGYHQNFHPSPTSVIQAYIKGITRENQDTAAAAS